MYAQDITTWEQRFEDQSRELQAAMVSQSVSQSVVHSLEHIIAVYCNILARLWLISDVTTKARGAQLATALQQLRQKRAAEAQVFAPYAS